MNEYIDAIQASKILGVTVHAIYRYIREGRLKPYQVPHNKRIVVKTKDVENLKKPQEIK
jgi:predicted site-specific integrase-resolvase